MFTYQLALSDRNGLQEFYVSEGTSDASSSLLAPHDHLKDHPDTQFNKKITVSAKTLDSWAAEHGITSVDLLWLDMQGFEMNMLEASPNILDTVKVIHTEASTRETYKGVVQYREYRSFLESRGFKVMIEAIPEGWDMGNVLFVRK
jgi:FkbM family methyltransferase